jgi:hypothetical protein
MSVVKSYWPALSKGSGFLEACFRLALGIRSADGEVHWDDQRAVPNHDYRDKAMVVA